MGPEVWEDQAFPDPFRLPNAAMALVISPFPMTEADIDRLEELLESEIFKGEAMLLDELQGFLCSVISGPDPVMPEEWLPLVLGEDPRYESADQADEVVGLLMRFYNQIASDLNAGQAPALILYPVDEDGSRYDYGPWADGYLLGSELGARQWLEAAGEHSDELAELLEAFFLLNGSLKEDVGAAGEPWLSEAAEARALRAAEEDLPSLVLSIHQFWKALADKPEPMVRDSEKVGRNDACPCGSGRKFKQCCGDPRRLH